MKKYIQKSVERINKEIELESKGIEKKYIHCRISDGLILNRYFKKSDFKGILVDSQIITVKQYNTMYM